MNHGAVDSRTDRTPANAWGGAEGLSHVLSMTWRDGLFLHWPVTPRALEPHVPDQLTLDTREGRAWIGVLPFVLARAGVRGSPPALRLTFPELNVRTPVRYRGDPGLYFFSIDVDSAFVASAVRRLTRLPCHRARMHVSRTDERVAFSSSRPGRTTARFSVSYQPDGPLFYADPDSIDHWLTARRRFYAPEEEGVLTAEIAHPPWPLQSADATVHENTMFAANDLPEPDGEPVAHYCGELAMTGSLFRRLDE